MNPRNPPLSRQPTVGPGQHGTAFPRGGAFMSTPTRQQPEPGAIDVGETTGNAPANERIKPAQTREPKRDSGIALLILLGLMLLATIPLVLDVHQPEVWTEQEALHIAISAETHERKTPLAEGETSVNQWTPVYRGVTRWDLPPGGVWLNQVFYADMPAQDESSDQPYTESIVLRSRIASVAMVLLLVGAVFWAGHSISGTLTGSLSALVVMSMPLVVGFGRIANPDISAVAFSTLSIAGALWAMRPMRATPSLGRQLIGWLVCGVGLGVSSLTAGPIAVSATLLCTVTLAMLCPRRIGHIMGVLASTAIAALMLTPWVLHVHDHDPDVWQGWINQINPMLAQGGWGETLTRGGWRLMMAAIFAGLWLLWLIPAVAQPFSTSTGNARRLMLLGLGWLATSALVIAFAPVATRPALMLYAAAPAAIAIALVIRRFHDLSAEGRHARLWRITRWLSCGVMLILSIALPITAYLINERPDLVAWLPQPELGLLAAMHWSYYAGAGLALLLITFLAFRFALAQHPAQTAGCLALWLIACFSLATLPIARGPMLSTAVSPPTLSAPVADETPTP